MSLANALVAQYPGISIGPDITNECVISDEKIVQWNRPETQPEEATVLLAYDPVPDIRQLKIQESYAQAKHLIDAATADYSTGEQVRWPQLEAECRQYQIDATVGPYMQSEVTAGQRTASELAALVVGKADTLEAYRVSVIAKRTALVNAINAAADIDTLEAINPAALEHWT